MASKLYSVIVYLARKNGTSMQSLYFRNNYFIYKQLFLIDVHVNIIISDFQEDQPRTSEHAIDQAAVFLEDAVKVIIYPSVYHIRGS